MVLLRIDVVLVCSSICCLGIVYDSVFSSFFSFFFFVLQFNSTDRLQCPLSVTILKLLYKSATANCIFLELA